MVAPREVGPSMGRAVSDRWMSNSPKTGWICSTLSVGTTSRPPNWIKPQLTRLVDEAPAGAGWLHEIKYDGYRMHARIDGRDIKLLTAHTQRPQYARANVAAQENLPVRRYGDD